AAVSRLAYRYIAQAARSKDDEFPRYFLQEFLCDYQRVLFRPGIDLLHARNGRRPHPVRGRLAVRDESAGGQVDGKRVDIRLGQGQDIERQCEAAAKGVISPDGAESTRPLPPIASNPCCRASPRRRPPFP